MKTFHSLSFEYHDTNKMSALDRKKYMDLVKETPNSPYCFVAKEWEKGLEQSGLLSLLFMPQFGQSTEVNTYVKQLLVVFHGGYLWLEKEYSVDVNLISTITGISRGWLDPLSLLEKGKDPVRISRIKKKYGMVKASRGFLILSINDPNVHFTAKILSYKMLWMSGPNQCTTGIVALDKLCAEGVQINWSQFLLNELLHDTTT